ncbi:MAG: hypothetical protein IT158_30980 [Bryobacterales bacterium]|nr:hypothetical protein [Bryobacterales bacterium]
MRASHDWLEAAGRRIGALWCRFAHPASLWPFGGQYRCATCLRAYPVPWK